MKNRLMTPFCFASVMAAMLFAEGAFAAGFEPAGPAPKKTAGASGSAPDIPHPPALTGQDGSEAR